MYTDTRPAPSRAFFKLPAPEAMSVARKVARKPDGSVDWDILRDFTDRYKKSQERKARRSELVFQEQLPI